MRGTGTAGRTVGLFASPWVKGFKAIGYFGPLHVHIWLPYEFILDQQKAWTWSLRHVLELLAVHTENIGGNAVVGLEITVDPFHVRDGVKGLRLDAIGTSARLEDQFNKEGEWPKDNLAEP